VRLAFTLVLIVVQWAYKGSEGPALSEWLSVDTWMRHYGFGTLRDGGAPQSVPGFNSPLPPARDLGTEDEPKDAFDDDF
jgi:hypothetical protein